MIKNKYLLFSGMCYYPAGGLHDFKGSFESIESAKMSGKIEDWYHIVDKDTLEIIDSDD